MIIHQTHKKFSLPRSPWIWRIGLILCLIPLGLFIWDYSAENDEQDGVIICDAENTSSEESGKVFVKNDHYFKNGQTQNRTESRSGQYSSRITKDEPYGMLYTIKDAKAGSRYRLRVWRLGNWLSNTFLACNIMLEPERYYRQTGIPVSIDEKGWEELMLTVQVPQSYQGEEISVYVYGTGAATVYFDDLTIEEVAPWDREVLTGISDTLLKPLDLEVSEKGMLKLQQKRKEALKEFTLITDDKDWVKGKIKGKEDIPVSLRLKGDQLDHLYNDQWSFRIKVKDPHAWNRMLTFSVHNTRARSHLDEWVYHQFLLKEDVLTTRYDFAQVSLNGKALGIYGYEEHFEKQLPEYNQRREGPILKFDEDPNWAAGQYQNRFDVKGVNMAADLKAYEAADILPFKEKKTLESPVLREQFEIAQNLLYQFRTGNKQAKDIFDIDKLALHLAIIDLNEAYHNIIWHNQRYYFNPVISKLEPIGFDGFTEVGAFNYNRWIVMANRRSELSGVPEWEMYERLFFDSTFIPRYIHFLDKITEPSYLDDFFLDIELGLQQRQSLIQTQYPAYAFDEAKMRKRASRIRTLLKPLSYSSIKAYTDPGQKQQTGCNVANFHHLPLEIIGTTNKEGGVIKQLNTPIFLKAFDPNVPPVYEQLDLEQPANLIVFRLPGKETLYYSRISKWKMPNNNVPAQAYTNTLQLPDSSICTLKGKEIYIKKGNHTIDRDILIPKGYRFLSVGAGTQLDFVKGAKLISHAPLQLIATEAEPIKIISSDKQAQGLTVLQAPTKSRMQYVQVENFNTLAEYGWNLTGAVTFYESDVDIQHCVFTKNHCEDALNIIRSEFSLQNSLISYTFADGFDADFCTGEVKNTVFDHTGNDGMDVSGSKVSVDKIKILAAGDKGISVGEQSNVEAGEVEVLGAVIGVASKDLSTLSIKDISLKNCNTGFTAFQKKPEYGGASINVQKYEAEKVQYLYQIDPKSTLVLENRTIQRP